jgi:hypothetical protein
MAWAWFVPLPLVLITSEGMSAHAMSGWDPMAPAHACGSAGIRHCSTGPPMAPTAITPSPTHGRAVPRQAEACATSSMSDASDWVTLRSPEGFPYYYNEARRAQARTCARAPAGAALASPPERARRGAARSLSLADARSRRRASPAGRRRRAWPGTRRRRTTTSRTPTTCPSACASRACTVRPVRMRILEADGTRRARPQMRSKPLS